MNTNSRSLTASLALAALLALGWLAGTLWVVSGWLLRR